MSSIKTWPAAFHGQQMAVSGGTQYVRVGGHGPAVLLLHGFGDTGDMWVPLAEILVKDHTVIVPDLRGMGLSSHQDGGYEKIAQAQDLAGILDKLGVQDVALVSHDIGNMVGYALAALYPARVSRWVVMDAPLPGIGHWDDQLKNPKVWHFNFRGPDVERLVERLLELAQTWTQAAFLAAEPPAAGDDPEVAPYAESVVAAGERFASQDLSLVRKPVSTVRDIQDVAMSFSREPHSGLWVIGDPFTTEHEDEIIAEAARYHLPSIYGNVVSVERGGLVAYAQNTDAYMRQPVSYIDRILKGVKPSDLPVQNPTKFKLVINLKTAKALGLTVPQTLLVAADEVIE